MGKKARRIFTTEFKAEAVKLVIEGGVGIAQVASDLGISDSGLRKWVEQAKVNAGQGPAGVLTTEEHKELLRLRRENKTLRMEREILKKATAFFAKENG